MDFLLDLMNLLSNERWEKKDNQLHNTQSFFKCGQAFDYLLHGLRCFIYPRQEEGILKL